MMRPSDDDWRQPARSAKRAAEEADIRGAECKSNGEGAISYKK